MGRIYKNNIRITDYQGVNRLLQRVINGVIQDEISEDKARVISTLCNTLLKSFEGDLNEEEQRARIEQINARTEHIRGVGQEIEDMSDVIKQIYGDNYKYLEGNE